jgi:hypothetical protein
MIAAGLLAALACLHAAAGPRPILRLEKPVYTVDESIRFWVGVTAEEAIPEALQVPLILHWTRPDRTKTDENVSWPIDGDCSLGWEGGWGFGTRRPELGRYTLSLEFAGQRTAELSFDVVANPFRDSMTARWVFAAGAVDPLRAVLHGRLPARAARRFPVPRRAAIRGLAHDRPHNHRR